MQTDTEQQRAIYANVAEGSGHTLVVARAGTGKTTTIERALSYVPRDQRCLFVAFNKSVADELRRRVSLPNVTVGTCHSFGLSALTASCGSVAVDQDRALKIINRLSTNRSERFAVLKAVGLAKGLLIETVDEVIDACDEFGIEMGDWPERFARLVTETMRCTADLDGTVDYNDMVWLPVTHPDIEVPKFDRVFVDEVQDLNASQVRLVQLALKPGGRICAIGDDKQAVYQFRGADKNAINGFRAALKSTELPLTTSFRCARAVIKEAQRFVPDIQPRPDAPDGVVRRDTYANCLEKVEYGDFILSRTNAPLLRTALQLLKSDCRVSILGREFGTGLVSLVYKLRAATPQHLVINARNWLAKEESRLAKKDPPDEAGAELARDKFECLEALAATTTTIDHLVAKLKHLFEAAGPGACVTLATTHKAKGLERDKVWVLADTYLRPRKGVVSQEEKNLYYVAVTRAKNELVLVNGLPGARN